ncbi:family 16 glycoside hydrolase [Maribellus sediminis]|uniref:family 16 glycoside hydrolase n=1 Tax=Maribellus sediminis TaxID=2696285 RepID=UPI0014321474|nr:family 16 glycoside hydrolase [Maribellus sediminis]
MKKNIVQLFTLLLLSVMVMGATAQDRRTLDTKVADLLAQMPAKNLAQLDNAMAEFYQMGSEGFQKLAGLLVPPGTGDDTAVRFALNSFSRYASDFGREKEKAFAEENLLIAIKKQSDVEVSTFLMNQLNLVGGIKTVEALPGYLTNEALVEPATQAMLATGVHAAAEKFLEALPTAPESAKMTLIRALGQLKCKRAVAQITPFATSDNLSMRKTALTALAEIGSPDSYKTLLKAASDVDFKYDAANAAESFIVYTDRLGAQDETDLMKKACKAIFKANGSADQLHNYSSALFISAKYLGNEVTPMLLVAVNNPDKAFRYSVLNIAEKTGDIADTRLWVEKAASETAEVKADIISMLGRRGDTYATAFVNSNLEASAETVRQEAIVALAQLQGKETIPTLVAHLTEGQDIETTKATLNTLLDKEHLYTLEAALKNSNNETKAAFIELVAAKSGSQYFNEVLATTASNNTVEKTAAFNALKSISNYDNTDALLKLLHSVSDLTEIAETQAAIIAATTNIEAEKHENGKVLTALKSSNKKERLFPILPKIGGPVALETVTNYFNNGSGTVKGAAFEALASWTAYEASQPLFEVCKTSEGDYRRKAFSNYVRLVRSADIPDDQKLLQYRKVMAYAQTDEDKNNVISSIGRLKTFLSLVYLERYFNEEELAPTVAYACMRIAMPGSDESTGMSGEIVRRILEKAKNTLSGEDSQYDRINIQKYLDEMPKDKGFVSMFNGKNLDGWQGMLLNGNPIAIAKLSDEERAKEQVEADKKMLENWSVKDGQIVFSGKGANLVSVKRYKDFEMIVDWKITKEGDSGIYLRGTPQVQIWDTSRVEVGAQVGSGGLYNNNADNVRNPLLVADNPVDEWNTFRITMIGENVTVYLNGELVVDNVRMDNYWDRSIPIFSEGTIELQAHGNELAFRDVYVREIDTKNIGLTQEEINEGFVTLFNGKNLDGWQGNLTDYYAENGILVVNPKMGGHGNLFTENEYSDFVFRFEFKLTPGANNGLGIRAPLEGDAAYVGMELQILDNTAPIYANLHDYQYHGSVYGVIPAKRGYLNPVGDWNYEEVTVKGSKIKIVLNGVTIVDGDIKEASKNGTLDGNNHPGLKRDKGYIGFLGHGSELYFRNIRIKDLSK